MSTDYTRSWSGDLPSRAAALPRPVRLASWQVLGIAALVSAALVPVDGAIAQGLHALGSSLGGDIRRELETLQQYGAGGSIVLIGIVIWLLDPGRRERLPDWAGAMAVTGVIVLPLKILIGRPRPKFDDPLVFLGPTGTYPVGDGVGERRAWEVFSGISSDLWSMPSSHTAFAAVMSVFLMSLYPRLRPLAIAMVGIVAAARILFGAHYPSDVVLGGTIGWVASTWAMERRLGSHAAARLLGRSAAR